MTQIWYASERLDQGMTISDLINDTIIRLNLYEFKKEGIEIESDNTKDSIVMNKTVHFLDKLLFTLDAIDSGGNKLSIIDSYFKSYTLELIRKRAGNISKLQEEINKVKGELEKILTGNPVNLEDILPQLSELFQLAVNTVDQNKELILVPTR